MYVGVDTSTQGIALGILYGDNTFGFVWYPLVGTLYERLEQAQEFSYEWFDEAICSEEGLDGVAVEEPIYIQNGTTHKALCIIYAGVILGLLNVGYTPDSINISTWKKNVVGVGNANKEQIKEWVINSLWEIGESERQDIYDALAIAIWEVIEK